ncbi:MAG: hypothetical protein RLZZ514_954 [Actinomycetota bacterium]
MVIKINPARVPVWRSPTSLQLGLGNTSIRLDNLTNPQEQLLQLLYRGVADAAIDDVARDVGASKSETAALVARVAPALIQVEETNLKRTHEQRSPDPFIAQAFAEIIRASFSTDRDGALVLANRASKRVFINELNRVGLLLLQALATAGIGEICTEDRTLVTTSDVGALGYSQADIGRTRVEAAAALLARSQQPAKLSLARTSDFVVMIANHLVSSEATPAVGQKQIPRLMVELSFDQSRISPVLIAGVTSCLDCRITSELDADEGWAAMMTQLKFRTERLDDSQTALLCAGLALERTLSWVDSGAIGDNQSTVIDHRTGRLTHEVWQIDPECHCQSTAA